MNATPIAAQTGRTPKDTFIAIVADLHSHASTKPVGGIWCSECQHEREERDPHGTGDAWYTVRVCGLPDFTPCPYGKLEMDGE